MSKQEFISRYLLIINYLKRGQATWHDILNHLETQSEISGYNYVITQRTFQRDINEIRSLWEYDIQNNKVTGEYFIKNLHEEFDNNSELLDTFNLFNALSLTNNYSTYIQFETRQAKGTEHIYNLLHAIKNNFVIDIEYHKFYETSSETVTLNPYLIKQFKGRWYLLCYKVEADDIRTYALDRIKNISIKKKKFKTIPEFNRENYFAHCFGIITPDYGKPEKIVFSLTSFQANYLKSYPLHPSQNIVKENANNTIFEITVYVTEDLLIELFSHGAEIEIISPEFLRKQFTERLKNASKLYKKD